MREILTGVPDGLAPLVLARLAEEARGSAPPLLLHVARDDRRLEALAEGLTFFAPKVRVIQFPAWDTVPYDRIGPNAEIVATRIAALARLAAAAAQGPDRRADHRQRHPAAPAPARVHPPLAEDHRARPAHRHEASWSSGSTWPASSAPAPSWSPASTPCAAASSICSRRGASSPVRLDFFGDTLEHMKAFDPETQRTGKIVQKLTLMPISEVAFGEEAEKRFRRGYVEMFGPAPAEDPLYEAISAGQRYPGMEHWLPLFHEHLETLFDYVPEAPVSFDHLADEAVGERLALIADTYEARVKGLETLTFGAPPYKPVPPAAMFLRARSGTPC